MKQAEDDAAALFRLDGPGTGAPSGGSGTTGEVQGGNGENGAATTGGSPGEEASAFGPRLGPKFANKRHDPAGLGGTPPRTLSPAVKEMLRELDPQVAEWVKLSPTLMLQLEDMAARGVKFTTDPDVMTATLITGPDAKTQFQSVVDAAAANSYQILTEGRDGESRDQYLERQAQNEVKFAGAYMFNQIAVWNDNDAGILHRPRDPGGYPMTHEEFAAGRRIYGEWAAGNINTEEAILQMGAVRGQRIVSTSAGPKTQQEVWAADAAETWEDLQKSKSAGNTP
jgi:hypothetical protein